MSRPDYKLMRPVPIKDEVAPWPLPSTVWVILVLLFAIILNAVVCAVCGYCVMPWLHRYP